MLKILKKFVLSITLLCAIHSSIVAVEIKKIKTIPINQNKIIIQQAVNFSVTETGHFLFPDWKAGNIKIYDKHGKLVKVWGRRGMGPNEFGYPEYCDYRAPYLALIDTMKRRLIIFKSLGDLKFEKILDKLHLELGSDIKIMDEETLLISGYKLDPEKNEYDLYFYNPFSGQYRFILPTFLKYGLSSPGQRKTKYHLITPIGIHGYTAPWKNHIYYLWEGNLKVFKIDLKTLDIQYFGKETLHYKQPTADKKLYNIYHSPKTRRKTYMARQKYSYVTGVFTDDDFVAVLYANYNEALSGWQTRIHMYSHDGKFLNESPLDGAVNIAFTPVSPFSYDNDKNILYFLSRTIDKEDNDEYYIVMFRAGTWKRK